VLLVFLGPVLVLRFQLGKRRELDDSRVLKLVSSSGFSTRRRPGREELET
jgi:hypothetical protein